MDFPEIDELNKQFNRFPNYDYASTVLVAIQHLLPTNGSLFEALDNRGLSYSRMCILGKVYSTNVSVYHELVRRGVQVNPHSKTIESITLEKDYIEHLSIAAEQTLGKALELLRPITNPNRTLLVVDDGGVLIANVIKTYEKIRARIVAVEQTRSGAELVKRYDNSMFPIINIAESAKKLKYESPYIVRAIIKRIEDELAGFSIKLRNCKVLLVGNGVIGSQIANQLKSKVKEFVVFDKRTGDKSDVRNLMKDKHLIIGCTGKSWMPNDYKALLRDGVILASTSSSNTEFMGIQLNSSHVPSATYKFKESLLADVHSSWAFDTNQGLGWILNAGFPVNFTGQNELENLEDIKFTRSIMLTGILQGLTKNNPNGLSAI